MDTASALPGEAARAAANPLVARIGAPPIAEAARWASDYDGRLGPLLDCSQAVPSHAPPAALSDRLASAAAAPRTARYGPILGDEPLREAYAGSVSALYGAPVRPEDVAITSGCNQAFFAAMIAVARAGEAVVLAAPWYFNHKMTLDMLGIEARIAPTRAEEGFLPRLADIDAATSPLTRAVVLVSPNNPTGAIYPEPLLAAILDYCRRRGLFLVIDETYRDFRPDLAVPPHRLYQDPRWPDHLVSLYSFSKAYAVPGHRVGALSAGRDLMLQIEKIVDCVQICAPRPAQDALAWAIGGLEAWRSQNAARIAARAELFTARFAALPDWRLEQAGAYFAYLRHPFAGISSQRVAAALARRLGIVTLPGAFFGPGQDDHLRLAFANVAEDGIEELARRLSSHTAALAQSERWTSDA